MRVPNILEKSEERSMPCTIGCVCCDDEEGDDSCCIVVSGVVGGK